MRKLCRWFVCNSMSRPRTTLSPTQPSPTTSTSTRSTSSPTSPSCRSTTRSPTGTPTTGCWTTATAPAPCCRRWGSSILTSILSRIHNIWNACPSLSAKLSLISGLVLAKIFKTAYHNSEHRFHVCCRRPPTPTPTSGRRSRRARWSTGRTWSPSRTTPPAGHTPT